MSCRSRPMSTPSRRLNIRKKQLQISNPGNSGDRTPYTGFMLRVPYDDLLAALNRAMLRLGLEDDRATQCARLFAETTRDGVYTHGLNRFPRFAESVRNGSVDVHAEPTRT